MSVYDVVDTITTIRQPSSAQLCLDSADRINPKFSVGQNNLQTYNNFTITKNQNLLQGAFKRLTLSEIRFPFGIPNVNERNNSMQVNIGGVGWATITVNEGFYSGTELATALTNIFADLEFNGDVYPLASTITVVYNLPTSTTGKDGSFTFSSSVSGAVDNYLSLEFRGDPALGEYQNRFLQLLGMENPFIPITYDCREVQDIGGTSVGAPLETGVAPLLYTSYIDIVSEQLTNFQRVKDINTNNVPRQGIIYRLFIVDEASENNPNLVFGTFPFTIYRKLVIPKVIRWSGEHSVGQIDISLYDQFGEPLYVPQQIAYVPVIPVPAPPTLPYTEVEFELPQQDFQITFICSEE